MGGRFARQLSVLLAIIAILLIRIRTDHDHPEQGLKRGGMSSQQALKHSEPLLRILAPQAATQNIYVQPARELKGSFLYVDSRDPAGNSLAILTWNVDAGELTTIACYPPALVASRQASLSMRAAAQRMRGWLGALGVARNPQRWRPIRTPLFRAGKVWRGSWAGEGRRVSLSIDMHSGELIFASVLHRQ